MSGPRLRLEIDTTGATDELHDIGQRARDAKPVLRVIQGWMAEGAAEQFATEGGRGGSTWEPDKPATIRGKLAKGQDPRTERATLALEQSLMPGGKNNIHRLSKASTTFGTKLFYARFQGHKRQLLKLTLGDKNRWGDAIVHYILSGEVP